MKKWQLLLSFVMTVLVISACGSNTNNSQEADNKDSQFEENVEKETNEKGDTDVATPKEPTEADTCAFCDMVVYEHDHEMGVFTAQAVGADGEHLFFDDSGCLLNMERKLDESFQTKWVRDYATNEWIEMDEAIVVHGDIATPMKYGYAFFKDKADANKFVEENSDKNATISSWEDIDHVSHERYMKKMQNENGDSHDMQDHVHDDDDEDGHN